MEGYAHPVKLLELTFRAKVVSSGRNDSSVRRTLSWAQSPHVQSESWARAPSCPRNKLRSLPGVWMAFVRVWVSAPQEGECGEQCRDPGSLWRLTPSPSTRVATLPPADYNIISLVVALVAGKLSPTALQETKNEVSPVCPTSTVLPMFGVWVFCTQGLLSLRLRRLRIMGPRYTSLE